MANPTLFGGNGCGTTHWLGCTGYLGRAGWPTLLPDASWHLTHARPVPRKIPVVDPVQLRLRVRAFSSAGARCVAVERKQRRGRFLTRGQRAVKDHGLIGEAAAPEVADCHDQRAPRSPSYRSSSPVSGHRQRCRLSGCARNHRRSNRTISFSWRPIADPRPLLEKRVWPAWKGEAGHTKRVVRTEKS
jgi:hypothetical protein